MAQTYTNQHVCKERIERKKDIKPENGWFSVVYKGRRARETRRRRRRRRFRFRPFLDILVRYYTSPCFLCAIITTLVKNKKNARKNLTDLSFFFPPPPPIHLFYQTWRYYFGRRDACDEIQFLFSKQYANNLRPNRARETSGDAVNK